jgi:hypothetical protein
MLARSWNEMVYHLFVFCKVCEKWISEESRHGCSLDPEYAAERDELRRARIMEGVFR